jgi:hypothetical protein
LNTFFLIFKLDAKLHFIRITFILLCVLFGIVCIRLGVVFLFNKAKFVFLLLPLEHTHIMVFFIRAFIMAFMESSDDVGVVILVLMPWSWNKPFIDSWSTGSISLVEGVLEAATSEWHRWLLG